MQKKFLYDKLRGIKSQIRLWSWRGLSLFNKVTINKSLLFPNVLYITSVLSSPLEFIKAFQTITYSVFLEGSWQYAGTAVINDFKFCGLN